MAHYKKNLCLYEDKFNVIANTIACFNVLCMMCFDNMTGIVGRLSTITLVLFVVINFITLLYSGKKNNKIKLVIYVSVIFCIYSFFLKEYIQGQWSYLFGIQSQTAVSILICTIQMVCICIYAKNEKKLELLLKTISFSGVVMAGILLLILRTDIFLGLHSMGMSNILSKYGLNSNQLGISFAIAFITSYYLYQKQHLRHFLYYLIINFLFGLLSGSRKVIIYFGICFFVFTIFNNKKSKLRNISFIIIIVIIVYYALISIPFLYQLLGRRMLILVKVLEGTEVADSTQTRNDLIEQGMNLFKNNPVWGYGLNYFSIYHRDRTGMLLYAHNNYVELLVSGGIVFTILYYLRYALILPELIRKSNTSLEYRMCLSFVISFVLSDFAAVTYYTKLYYVVLGIIFSIMYNKLRINTDLQIKVSRNLHDRQQNTTIKPPK